MDLFDQRRVVGDVCVNHDLHVREATAIVHLKKREVLLGLSLGSHPTSHINMGAGLNVSQYLYDLGAWHDEFDPSKELDPDLQRSRISRAANCDWKFPGSRGNMQTKTALGRIRGPLFAVALWSIRTSYRLNLSVDQSSIPSSVDRPPRRAAFFSSGGTGAGAAGSLAGIAAGAHPAGAHPLLQAAVVQPPSQQPLTTS